MLEKIFDFPRDEAELYGKWQDSGLFSCHLTSDSKPYVIMMPPPNVTGTLHLGHALNYTLQDILVRFKRAKGFDVLWQPGTDHAGIATQMVVERQLETEGLSRHVLGREIFTRRVWQWKEQNGAQIVSQQQRLGISPDWSRQRFTLDEGLCQAVAKVFVNLYDQGLIYRDQRLVNWDPKLQTAVSDLEVLNKEVKGHFWYIGYPLASKPTEVIVIATTRPETLLGDVAVAVHPDDERYQQFIGQYLTHPLTGRTIPLIADCHCEPSLGTGAVKVTPAHDFNDWEIGKRHNLPLLNILDSFSCLNENVPAPYQKLSIKDAREKVLAELQNQGRLIKVEPLVHMVPHGERSGVPIHPWLTEQWFIDAAALAGPALTAVEDGQVGFVPEHWRNTYFEWLNNIQPWCISRQLWWGHQIPVWYGPDKQVFVALTEAEAQAKAARQYGQEVALVRDPDVLDTWFSSALWPFSTLGWPEDSDTFKRYYPTDVLITGFDIIFFWVARMIMLGLHFTGRPPFKQVYIHNLVRDEHGQKMSKSKGNIIDPLEILDKYGCDTVRFALASLAAPGRDVRLGDARLEGYRNFMTKLWNAARFLEMNHCQIAEEFDPTACQNTLNRWLVSEVARLEHKISKSLDAFRFDEAALELYHFLWGTYCDYYLEFLKPLFQEKSSLSEEAKSVALWSFLEFLKLAHPFVPFITEKLWQVLAPNRGLLASRPWPSYISACQNEAAAQEMRWTIALINRVRSLRAEFHVPPGAWLNLSTANPTIQPRLAAQKPFICRLARLEEFTIADPVSPSSQTITFLLDSVPFTLHVGAHIDLPAEINRLQKEIITHEREIQGYQQKLANPEFLAKAKPEVVAEVQQRLKAARLDKEHKTICLAQLQ